MPVVAIVGLEPAESTLLAALIAAIGALYLNDRTQRAQAADRRRGLHGEAYQAVLEWCEGVWRVRRRAKDGSDDAELVKHFHAMQEKIAYYEGWLSMEDARLGQAFRTFLTGVMDECRPLIQEAWSAPGRHPSEPAPPYEDAPKLDELKVTFLERTRKLESRWPWVRLHARHQVKQATKPQKQVVGADARGISDAGLGASDQVTGENS